MKTTLEMAREVYGTNEWTGAQLDRLEQVVALARADEREQGQRWFDAVTAQHKQLILAEKEACAKLIEAEKGMNPGWQKHLAAAIRNRGQA
jgi:hypothetical protein